MSIEPISTGMSYQAMNNTPVSRPVEQVASESAEKDIRAGRSCRAEDTGDTGGCRRRS